MILRMPVRHTDNLRVALITPSLACAVRALRVDPSQHAWVGDPTSNLIDAQADPHSDAMAVLLGEQVVGFYRIDMAPDACGDGWGRRCAALRALVIDRDLQGQGLGTRAVRACCDDLQRRHPRLHLLMLQVGCTNHAAIAAYRNAGFIDTGQLRASVRSGPQRRMVRQLQPSGVAQSAP